MWSTYRRLSTYQTDRGSTGRELIQNRNNTHEGFRNPAIVTLEFAERSCLVLKQCSYGLDGIAILEFLGERVAGQCHARLNLVVQQGGVEEDSKTR